MWSDVAYDLRLSQVGKRYRVSHSKARRGWADLLRPALDGFPSIALGRGEASETVWTTDLSHEYVTINADYRS